MHERITPAKMSRHRPCSRRTPTPSYVSRLSSKFDADPFASIDNLAAMSNQTVGVPHTSHQWNVLSKMVSDPLEADVLLNRDGTTGDLAKLINSIQRRKASGGFISLMAVPSARRSSSLSTVSEHPSSRRAEVTHLKLNAA